ncbi:ABC transporter substrate-binding protein [Aureimonas jatrophae]|uniref:Carbohydrate ABC transporter substrate-binding protein, CUT1 family n=1 Tax=Aureimonas jatrophae TaxID=1166073 RepID=A0A1H0F4J2_9HYPH|nr:ABC transporter substrate-binding protein [Aureimonas jatrophae]MBB3950182.1 multiple sugar transport system substrate-binding protein [Aureimonas jatrophae]SDN89588.1 carbohydrate ABC transporter substrate-binding protein, CUT1 family [Aureimonas jatrophae]
MIQSVTRRALLQGGAASLSLLALGGGRALAQDSRLRFLWWGSQERADRTQVAIGAYKSVAPGTQIVGEFAGWSDYWPRLATQVAGRNAPDLIQMDYRYIFEYARRGALMPLDEAVGGALAINDFGQANIDSGRVDGKLYGVNLGVNSSSICFNAKMWEDAKAEPPAPGQTWDQITESAKRFAANRARPGVFALADGGGTEPALELWLRQRGKALYTNDAKLGYDAADAAAWFQLWADLREAKACVPADVQALDQLNIESNALTTGKAATAFMHSNQFVGYQKLNKAKLTLGPYPRLSAEAPSGHYLKPSMLISLSANAPKDPALAFANFLVANPEGVKALGVERGVPASESMRAVLTPSLSETDRAMVDYIALITPEAGPLPPSPPPGAGELAFVLKRLNEEVGFERTAPEAAGEALVNEANAILQRG